MNGKISKTNENAEFFNGLIDEIQINGHERIRAKARLAQGEAMAGALVGLLGFCKRMLKLPFARPVRHPTTYAG